MRHIVFTPNPAQPPGARQLGASMMEVLASILVFSIGMLGLAALQTRSLKENFDLNQRTVALWQSQDLIDRVRANRTSIDTYIASVGSYDCDDDQSAPPTLCADTQQAGGSACSATEVAQFDSWDVFCNNRGVTIGSQTVNTTPIDLSVSLSCASGASPCTADDGLILDYQWTSKSSLDDEQVDDQSGAEIQQYVVEFKP